MVRLSSQLLPWLGVAALCTSCHGNQTSSAGPSANPCGQADDAASFEYAPEGCKYAYSPPSTLGLQDLALDDDACPVSATGSTPERVRLGLGGGVHKGKPGYADPTTTAAFTWETAAPSHAAKVRFGKSVAAMTSVQTGYTWTTPSSLGGPPVYMHEVHICGLTPGTTYFYQVGGGPAGSEVWSAAQEFTTVPSTGTLTLGVFGDARDQVSIWQAVHERMREAGVSMQIIGGDVVDTAALETLYTQWLDAIWHPDDAGSFLTLGQQMMVTINGNHENDLANSFANWAIPGVAGDPYAETYASFDVGTAHFLLIDDQQIGESLSTGSASPEAAAQLAWVDADLKAANDDRAMHPFIVVVGHRCMFSSSTHGSDADVIAARGALVPLYDRYAVDLVINGHDHDYERSKPLRAGSPATGMPIVGQGTTYVVSAGAGADAYATGAPQAFTAKSVAYGASTSYVGVYSLLTLSGNTLTLTSYGLRASSGAVADDDVIDTFAITR